MARSAAAVEFLEACQTLEVTHPGGESQPPVVIVMLTTSLNPGDIRRLNELPIQGYLNKPLTTEMVKDLVAQHFR